MAGKTADDILVEGAGQLGRGPEQSPEADALPKESTRLAPHLRRLPAPHYDAIALVLLVVFAVALCWPITSGKVPVASDTLALWPPWNQLPHEPIANSAIADSALLYLPWNVFERDAIRDGEWPLWDPYTFSGAPFAANSQSQLYYPLTWLLWLLPLSGAIQLLVLFNVWFAGAGMYLLCRHFRLSFVGALVAALGFAGSGMLQSALEFPGHASPYGWLPWMLLALDLALEKRSAAWTALAALACGLQLVSGNLQWCIYSYFALVCWIGWRFVASFARAGARTAMRLLLTATAALGGGLALAAVHLAPLLELTGLSVRGTTRVSSHSGPLYSLLRLLMPEYFGTSTGDVGAPLVFNDLWYVGIGVLMLAVLGLALPGRPERWLWAALALFAVLVTYGIGPFLYVRWLPGLSGLLPARIGYLCIFSACLLAAYALDSWIEACRTAPRRAYFALASLLALFGGVLGASPIAAAGAGDSSASLLGLQGFQLIRAWVLVLTFGLLLLGIFGLFYRYGHIHFQPFAKTRWSNLSLLCFAALIVATATDLMTTVPGYNSYIAPDQIVPASPATDWLRQQGGFGRVMALGVNDQPPTLVPNVQLLYAFQSVSGYDSLHTARYEDYWVAVDETVRPAGSSIPYANVFVRPQAYTSTLANLLSVRYIASPAKLSKPDGLTEVYSGEITIYENPASLPRAFVVGSAKAVPRDELLAKLSAPDFDPTREVLFEEENAPPIPSGSAAAQAIAGSANITSYRRNSVTLTVDLKQAGWLVLADQNYPGWTANVDGQERRIYTADYLLRSVALDAGRHDVVFQYIPTNYWASLALSATTLAILVIFLVATGFRYYFRREL